MITRDYILRQIHQLIRALERALFLRSNQEEADAKRTIDEALSGTPGPGSLLLPGLTREQVLEFGKSEQGVQADYASALADLLWHRADLEEDHELRIWTAQYALWLYEAVAATPGAVLPMDFSERLMDLRDLAFRDEE